MCGIVGYIGKREAKPILLEGLKRLEYRGYDSAGMAVIESGKIRCFKAVGKVSGLDEKANKINLTGKIGIAHTRWATHGKPSMKNAHPHSDCKRKIWLVHNGIIENYAEIKEKLKREKHHFRSDTDTEVVAHLVEEIMRSSKRPDFFKAVIESLKVIEGTYGIAAICADEPDKIVVARNGSPLLLGVGKDEFVIASDASAIISHTDKVVYLDDGDVVEVRRDDFDIHDLRRQKITRAVKKIDWTIGEAQKKGFAHFMLKEIHEQPEAVSNAIRGRVDKFGPGSVPILGGLKSVESRLRKLRKIIITSCGTSYYASLVGEYMLEEYAGIETEVEYASEFRYRQPVLNHDTAVLAISQSGETADTLEAVREARNKGVLALGIINVVGSTIARETDAGIYNHAGPEIGVASTKAFTSQLSILTLLTLMLGRQRNMSFVMGRRIASELGQVPRLIGEVLKQGRAIKKIALKYKKYNNFLYLGRKYNFPIALEGALKLKEISYVHAEGYPAGEMKHGPIAMVDKDFPSVILATSDSVYSKTKSAIEEIKARGGKVIAIATRGNQEIKKLADDVIYIPKTLEMLTPLVSIIPLQLFAYHVGVGRGYDVDKPRNLAKSVTVE